MMNHSLLVHGERPYSAHTRLTTGQSQALHQTSPFPAYLIKIDTQRLHIYIMIKHTLLIDDNGTMNSIIHIII